MANTKVMSGNLYRYKEIMVTGDDIEKAVAKLVFVLVNLRLEKDVSQNEMVRRTGLSKSMISKIETFHSTPSLVTLIKYAKALNIEMGLFDLDKQ